MKADIKLFENDDIEIIQSEKYEILISTADIAKSFGISDVTIRGHKANHKDELIDNIHFTTGLYIPGQFGSYAPNTTFWTRQGIIKLSFYIKSDKAKKFRKWVEDLATNKPEDSSIILKMQKNLVAIYQDIIQIKDHDLRMSLSSKLMSLASQNQN
jgi:prophage antirepressor-like protein